MQVITTSSASRSNQHLKHLSASNPKAGIEKPIKTIQEAKKFKDEYLTKHGVHTEQFSEEFSLKIEWSKEDYSGWSMHAHTIHLKHGGRKEELVHELEHLISDIRIGSALRGFSNKKIKDFKSSQKK